MSAYDGDDDARLPPPKGVIDRAKSEAKANAERIASVDRDRLKRKIEDEPGLTIDIYARRLKRDGEILIIDPWYRRGAELVDLHRFQAIGHGAAAAYYPPGVKPSVSEPNMAKLSLQIVDVLAKHPGLSAKDIGVHVEKGVPAVLNAVAHSADRHWFRSEGMSPARWSLTAEGLKHATVSATGRSTPEVSDQKEKPAIVAEKSTGAPAPEAAQKDSEEVSNGSLTRTAATTEPTPATTGDVVAAQPPVDWNWAPLGPCPVCQASTGRPCAAATKNGGHYLEAPHAERRSLVPGPTVSEQVAEGDRASVKAAARMIEKYATDVHVASKVTGRSVQSLLTEMAQTPRVSSSVLVFNGITFVMGTKTEAGPWVDDAEGGPGRWYNATGAARVLCDGWMVWRNGENTPFDRGPETGDAGKETADAALVAAGIPLIGGRFLLRPPEPVRDPAYIVDETPDAVPVVGEPVREISRAELMERLSSIRGVLLPLIPEALRRRHVPVVVMAEQVAVGLQQLRQDCHEATRIIAQCREAFDGGETMAEDLPAAIHAAGQRHATMLVDASEMREEIRLLKDRVKYHEDTAQARAKLLDEISAAVGHNPPWAFIAKSVTELREMLTQRGIELDKARADAAGEAAVLANNKRLVNEIATELGAVDIQDMDLPLLAKHVRLNIEKLRTDLAAAHDNLAAVSGHRDDLQNELAALRSGAPFWLHDDDRLLLIRDRKIIAMVAADEGGCSWDVPALDACGKANNEGQGQRIVEAILGAIEDPSDG